MAMRKRESCPTRCDPGDAGVIPTRKERSNRPAAANRAEETMGGFVVAKWNAAPLKTDQAMVRNARERAWSWVTSSTLVNRRDGVSCWVDIPFKRVS